LIATDTAARWADDGGPVPATVDVARTGPGTVSGKSIVMCYRNSAGRSHGGRAEPDAARFERPEAGRFGCDPMGLPREPRYPLVPRIREARSRGARGLGRWWAA